MGNKLRQALRDIADGVRTTVGTLLWGWPYPRRMRGAARSASVSVTLDNRRATFVPREPVAPYFAGEEGLPHGR